MKLKCAFYLLLCLISINAGAQMMPTQSEVFNEENILIVELTVNNHSLTDSLFIYATPRGQLIPLQEFFDAVEFPIQVEPESGIVDGWFLSPENTFRLNFKTRTLFIKNVSVSIPKDLTFLVDDFGSVYVDKFGVEEWFDLKLRLIIPQLQLQLTSDYTFAVVQRLNRARKRQFVNRSKATSDLPLIADVYHPGLMPVFDMQLAGQYDGAFASSLALQGAGDLFYHSSQWSVNVRDKQKPTARITLSRQFEAQSWAAGALTYDLGDVYGWSDPLVSSGTTGRGIVLHSESTNLGQFSFDARTIEGQGPPGWEVELYKNGLLIDFSEIESDGRFQFAGVEVNYGENVFDIQLFGPQGQRETYRESYSIGTDMVAPGKLLYYFSALEANTPVFGEPVASDSGVNVQGHALYGLTTRLSAGLGYSRLFDANANRMQDFAQSLLMVGLPGASVQFQYVRSNTGFAQHLGFISQLGETQIRAETSQFHSFRAAPNQFGVLQSSYSLGVDHYWDFDSLASIQTSLSFTEQQTLMSRVRQWSLRASSFTRYFRIQNDLDFFQISLEQDSALGLATLATLGRPWEVRSTVQYAAWPDLRFLNLNLVYASSSPIFQRIQAGLSVTNGVDKRYQLQGSLSKRFDQFVVSFDLGTDGRDVSGAVTFETALGYSKGWPQFQADGLTGAARLEVQAFLDENGNGIFDHEPAISELGSPVFIDANNNGIRDEEMLFEGLELRGRQRWQGLATNESGYLLLNDVPAGEARISVNGASLQDPFLQAVPESVRLQTHAGGAYQLYIPVVQLTEVEGSFLLESKGSVRGAAGLKFTIESIDQSFKVNHVAEFDGFFFVSHIPPGEYVLTIDPDFIQRTGYGPASLTFESTAQEGIVTLGDILLTHD